MDLVIFIGLQASGKSTFYRMKFLDTHAYVSKDLLSNNKRPSLRQLQLVEEALKAGDSVVVDNTNAAREERAGLIELGKRYDARIIGYYFEIQIRRSLERNQQRMGKEKIPEVGIFATLKRLVRPSYAEGFDQLYYVRSHDHFKFEVDAWIEEEGTTHER